MEKQYLMKLATMCLLALGLITVPVVAEDSWTGVFGKGHWFENDGEQRIADAWHFGDTGDEPFVLPDGKTGVFGKGHWFVNDGHQGIADAWHFGDTGDIPFVLPDGRTGVFGKGYWFVNDGEQGIADVWHFGAEGDRPFVLADGRTGVFGKGYWFVKDETAEDGYYWWHFGDTGDIPFVLPDGRTGVFGKGYWFVNDGEQGIADVWHFGDTGDRPFTSMITNPPFPNVLEVGMIGYGESEDVYGVLHDTTWTITVEEEGQYNKVAGLLKPDSENFKADITIEWTDLNEDSYWQKSLNEPTGYFLYEWVRFGEYPENYIHGSDLGGTLGSVTIDLKDAGSDALIGTITYTIIFEV